MHVHCWAMRHVFDDKDGNPWPCGCGCTHVQDVGTSLDAAANPHYAHARAHTGNQPTALRVECGHCGRQDLLPAELATIVVDVVMDSYYELRYDCRHCGGHNGGPLPESIGRKLVDECDVQLAINEGGMA